jgi:hypothetical protein
MFKYNDVAKTVIKHKKKQRDFSFLSLKYKQEANTKLSHCGKRNNIKLDNVNSTLGEFICR